jgi:ABC-type uncharacterized transport system permease subunit
VFGVLFAVFAVTFRANQVVTGLGRSTRGGGDYGAAVPPVFGISGVVP